MKIMLDVAGCKVEIEPDDNYVTLTDVVEFLIIPALLAVGFHPESVKHYIITDNDTEELIVCSEE